MPFLHGLIRISEYINQEIRGTAAAKEGFAPAGRDGLKPDQFSEQGIHAPSLV